MTVLKASVPDLREAIAEAFSDVLPTPKAEFVLQIEDSSWGAGVFVDMSETDAIPDRAILKVLLVTQIKPSLEDTVKDNEAINQSVSDSLSSTSEV